jgi:hypothetical protein
MPLNPEHILVPFAPAALPPGPWLVFAPHADDETFGMGGSLLKASKKQERLRKCWACEVLSVGLSPTAGWSRATGWPIGLQRQL